MKSRPSVSLADDHNIQSSDIEVILSDSYILARLIERIKFSSNGSRVVERKFVASSRDVDVTLSERYFSTIDVSIKGDRDGCTALRAELETIFQGAEESYSWTRRIDGLPMALLSTAATVLFFLGYAWLLVLIAGVETTKQVGWLLFVPAVFSVFAVGRLRAKMYPGIVFDVGKSGNIISSAKHWRTVGHSLALGVIASVIAAYVYDRIK